MKTKTKNILKMSPVSLAILAAMAIPTFALQAADEQEEMTEVIQVRGIRGGLEDALLKKRAADQVVDAISAEDIGQLPDDNLAEAMQRITGVQITRDAGGEGDTVQLRGLSVTNIQMNGVSMASNEFRTANFQDFSSSIVSGIEILKTPQADQIEGGIGGTVNLKTKKPNQLKEPLLAVNAAVRYTDSTEEYTPEGSISVGNNWEIEGLGKFGIIGAISYEERNSRGDTARVDSYRAYEYSKAGDPFADFNGDGSIDTNDNFIFPNGHAVRTKHQEYERIGAQVSLQLQPTEDLSLYLDTSYFARDGENATHMFRVRANKNRQSEVTVNDPDNLVLMEPTIQVVGDDGVVPFAVLGQGSVNKAMFNINADPSLVEEDRENYTAAFGAKYGYEDFTFEAEVSTSAQITDKLSADMLYVIKGGDVSYSFDTTVGTERPNWAFFVDGEPLDSTSPATPGFTLNSIQLDRSHYENEKNAAKLDFTHHLEWGPLTKYKAGFRLSQENITRTDRYRLKDGSKHSQGDPLFDKCTTDLGYDNFLGGISGDYIDNWVSGTCSHGEILDALGLRTIADPDNDLFDDDVEEKTQSVYFQVSFEQDVGNTDMVITGNAGIRYTKADIDAIGTVATPTLDASGNIVRNTGEDGDGSIVAIRTSVPFEGDYSYSLPSLNLNLEITPEMFVRFGAAKVVQRPAIGQIRPGRTIFAPGTKELNGTDYEVDANNSNLKPREARTYDLSWEYYFNNDTYVSIAPFYRDWLVEREDQVIEQQFGNETVAVQMPVNIDAEFGDQKGIEFSYQQAFTFLPSFWQNFGVNFNYSMIDFEENPNKLDVEGNSRALRVRISDDSANLALWYDDGKFSARLAGNWRTDYEIGNVKIERVGDVVDGASGDLVMTQDAATYWDFSMNYYATDKLRFNLSVNNLFDEVKSNYATHSSLNRGTTWSGTNWEVGVRYNF